MTEWEELSALLEEQDSGICKGDKINMGKNYLIYINSVTNFKKDDTIFIEG